MAIHLTPTSFSSLSIAYPNCLVVSISAISRSKLVMVFGLVAMTLLELKIFAISVLSSVARIAFPTAQRYMGSFMPMCEAI